MLGWKKTLLIKNTCILLSAVLAETLFGQKEHHTEWKKIHNSAKIHNGKDSKISQNIWFLIKKGFWSDLATYFCTSKPLFWAIWVQNYIFLEVLRTAGLQHKSLPAIESLTFPIENYPRKPKWLWSLGQNLGQIRPNVIKAKKLPTIAS